MISRRSTIYLLTINYIFMKKLFCFLTVALLAMLSLGVSSCSDDDKYGPATDETIIGTWQTDWRTFEEYDGELITERLTITFDANGAVTEIYEDKDEGVTETENGTWSLSGSILTIDWGHGEVEERECYISGNTLKIVEPEFNEAYYLYRIN